MKDLITDKEHHKLVNCLFLIFVCHQMEQGWILDRNRKRSFTFEDLTSSLDGISTLKGKPKIMIIQQFLEGKDRFLFTFIIYRHIPY